MSSRPPPSSSYGSIVPDDQMQEVTAGYDSAKLLERMRPTQAYAPAPAADSMTHSAPGAITHSYASAPPPDAAQHRTRAHGVNGADSGGYVQLPERLRRDASTPLTSEDLQRSYSTGAVAARALPPRRAPSLPSGSLDAGGYGVIPSATDTRQPQTPPDSPTHSPRNESSASTSRARSPRSANPYSNLTLSDPSPIDSTPPGYTNFLNVRSRQPKSAYGALKSDSELAGYGSVRDF